MVSGWNPQNFKHQLFCSLFKYHCLHCSRALLTRGGPRLVYFLIFFLIRKKKKIKHPIIGCYVNGALIKLFTWLSQIQECVFSHTYFYNWKRCITYLGFNIFLFRQWVNTYESYIDCSLVKLQKLGICSVIISPQKNNRKC